MPPNYSYGLTRFQAIYIQLLRNGGKRGRQHSWRALAQKFTSRYKTFCEDHGWTPNGDETNKETEDLRDIYPLVPNYSSSNQLLGKDLCQEAGEILGFDLDEVLAKAESKTSI